MLLVIASHKWKLTVANSETLQLYLNKRNQHLPADVTLLNIFFDGYTGLWKIILNKTIFQLEGTLGGHLVWLICLNQAQRWDHASLLRAFSGWVLKTSQDRDCTASLVNLFQYWTVFVLKDFFPDMHLDSPLSVVSPPSMHPWEQPSFVLFTASS